MRAPLLTRRTYGRRRTRGGHRGRRTSGRGHRGHRRTSHRHGFSDKSGRRLRGREDIGPLPGRRTAWDTPSGAADAAEDTGSGADVQDGADAGEHLRRARAVRPPTAPPWTVGAVRPAGTCACVPGPGQGPCDRQDRDCDGRPNRLSACSRACVDLDADLSNCGRCGTVCSAGMTCRGGRARCPSGLMRRAAPGVRPSPRIGAVPLRSPLPRTRRRRGLDPLLRGRVQRPTAARNGTSPTMRARRLPVSLGEGWEGWGSRTPGRPPGPPPAVPYGAGFPWSTPDRPSPPRPRLPEVYARQALVPRRSPGPRGLSPAGGESSGRGLPFRRVWGLLLRRGGLRPPCSGTPRARGASATPSRAGPNLGLVRLPSSSGPCALPDGFEVSRRARWRTKPGGSGRGLRAALQGVSGRRRPAGPWQWRWTASRGLRRRLRPTRTRAGGPSGCRPPGRVGVAVTLDGRGGVNGSGEVVQGDGRRWDHSPRRPRLGLTAPRRCHRRFAPTRSLWTFSASSRGTSPGIGRCGVRSGRKSSRTPSPTGSRALRLCHARRRGGDLRHGPGSSVLVLQRLRRWVDDGTHTGGGSSRPSPGPSRASTTAWTRARPSPTQRRSARRSCPSGRAPRARRPSRSPELAAQAAGPLPRRPHDRAADPPRHGPCETSGTASPGTSWEFGV